MIHCKHSEVTLHKSVSIAKQNYKLQKQREKYIVALVEYDCYLSVHYQHVEVLYKY